MTERQIINLIETTLYEKMQQNENFIRYSFYEVNVKYPFKNEGERNLFLKLLRTKLVNNKYKVYLDGKRFEYNNVNMMVQDNERLIGIKVKEVKENGRKIQKAINR